MPKGRKDIYKDAKKFDSKRATVAAARSAEVRRFKCLVFKTVRVMTDTTASDEIVTDKIAKFWEMRNVTRDRITPMMAELTPVYANAVVQGDINTLERIYRILGITFDSMREHNMSESVGETDEKSFEINYIVDGVKQEPIAIECEKAEKDGL